MISKEISDKYEFISILHKTAATAVYLVREEPEGEIRILKAIQKSHPNSANILSEANLLSEFKSPRIPTIYEIGQTTDYNYLVEEYIDGQPLHNYLLENKPVTLEKIISIFLEVCEVISILHISGTEPVLYRDLKPEHIIIKENETRLIDFGAAIRCSNQNNSNSYCSKSFAAPEQIYCKQLDARADIYGIGKVIEYCLPYLRVTDSLKLKKIVEKTTSPEKEKRVSSVKELMVMLETLRGKKGSEKCRIKYLNKSIAFVASERSVGCTHIAINFCKYMNDNGYVSFYKSLTNDKVVQMLGNNLNSYDLKDGVLYHNGFRGMMDYGPAIENPKPPKGYMIYDCGDLENKPKADILVYIIGLRPWYRRCEPPDWILDKNVIIVSNFGNMLSTLEFSKSISKKVYTYSGSSKPFKVNSKEKKFFDIVRKELCNENSKAKKS